MALKPSAFIKGGTPRSKEDLEAEAAAELRRALAGGDPRPGASGRSPPRRRSAPAAMPGVPTIGRSEPSITPDDEKQALTELALQQFAEREIGGHRSDDLSRLTAAAGSPEEMRNRALAELALRQARMARDSPSPPRPQAAAPTASAPGLAPPPVARRSARPGGVVSPSGPRVKRTSSDMPGSPRLTVAPTLTSSARTSPVPDEILSPRAPAIARSRQTTTRKRAPVEAPPARRQARRPAPDPIPEEPHLAPAPAPPPRRSKVVATARDRVTNPRPAAADVETDHAEPAIIGRSSAKEAPAAVPLAAARRPAPAADDEPDRDYDPDEALAASSHCVLAALSMLLGSFEVLPAPRYHDLEREARYDEIAGGAGELRELVEHFLDDLPG